MAGGIVINLDPSVADSFVRRYGVKEYDPTRFVYERARIWDTLAVGTVGSATMSAPKRFFNESTSTRGSNTLGLRGCNLDQQGRIPAGSVMVVDTIEAEWVARTAAGWIAADSKDAAVASEGGIFTGLKLNQKPVTEPIPLNECLVARGVGGSTVEDASATGATFLGVYGRDDGHQRTPEGLIKIEDSDLLELPIEIYGTATITQPPVLRVALVGLRIRPRG